MGVLIKNPQPSEDETPSQIAIDQEVLFALSYTWKGLTPQGAELVIKETERYQERYKTRAHLRPAPALAALIDNFPYIGNYVIREWEKRHHPNFDSDHISFIRRFLIEIWPTVYYIAGPRLHRIYTVDDNVKIRFDKIIAEANCGADFYDVYTTTKRNRTHINNGKKDEEDKLRPADEFMLQMKRFSAANPHLCPNCFMEHKLKNCEHIKDASRPNLAAYYLRDYEKKSGQTRPRRQINYATWLHYQALE